MGNMQKMLVDAACGARLAELVLKNGRVINVFSGRIVSADVAICGDRIVGVGRYDGEREIDLAGQFVAPGLIDAHIHLESGLAAPAEVVSYAALCGTTTFIADPHEAANVGGRDGLDYILRNTQNATGNVFIMLPSCVPATELEDNGYRMDGADLAPYLSNPRVLGLGEVMDCGKVISAEEGMLEKLRLMEGRPLDGHAGFLTDHQLAAYRLAGINTDHECTSFAVAQQELEAGMYIHIREGSAARNLEDIIRGILQHKTATDFFCFCTDDKHIDQICREGHINASLRKAVALGMDPVTAVRMATINPARCYGLKDLGGIAPGYRADLVIFEDLKEFRPTAVYFGGKVLSSPPNPSFPPCPEELTRTVHLAPIRPEQLVIPADGRTPSPVIGIRAGQIGTDDFREILPAADGRFLPNGEYNKCVVAERHHATGKVGVAPVKNFGLRGGAIGSSFGHDSHNLILLGDNDRDILLAAEELQKMGGGYVLVENGKVVGALPLPVMGLISERPFSELHATFRQITQKASEMGVTPGIDPFITMAFLALPVIPRLRLTPRGLYSVLEERFL